MGTQYAVVTRKITLLPVFSTLIASHSRRLALLFKTLAAQCRQVATLLLSHDVTS